MRISVSITNFSWPVASRALAGKVAAVARAAEDAGVHTVWVADHLFQADPASSPDEPMLEAYTTLGYLAGQTRRVRLGTLVTAAAFRAPALLAKQVATLDVLSGGRAWLGLGAGDNEQEAAAMGVPLPPVVQRFEILAETIDIVRRMWADDQSPYQGRHHRLAGPIGRPLPIEPPRLLIGGTGERRTLRLVAEHADACNLFDLPDGGAAVRRQLDVLARHCSDAGRPFDDIERTITTALRPDESIDEFVHRAGELAGLGIEHVVVITRGTPWTDDKLATIAGAVPQLAAA